MGKTKKIAAVVNPQASRGKVGRLWPQIREALEARLGPVTTRFTQLSGAGIPLTRELLQQGQDLIIAAGGDGTINEVANGFLNEDQPVQPNATLGILPLGTGGDFQRTLGIPSRVEDAIEIVSTGVSLPIDVGRAGFVGPDDSPQSRYFVNLASFGMGGAVALRAKNLWSRWDGKLAYLWATFVVVAGYRGRRVELELDGVSPPSSHRITNIAIGNGRYHGGGMHPCPTAIINDGMFEITIIDYLNPFELARDIRILYSDNVYRHPKVHHLRGRRMVARAEEKTLLEIDGEPLGVLPLEAAVVPQVLPIIVPRSSPFLA